MEEKRSGARWLKGIFSGTLGATVALTIREFFEAMGKKGGEIAVSGIDKVLKDNPRADLLYVLLALEPEAAAVLWKRHTKATKEGQEDAFVRTLGQALPKNEKGGLDLERAKAVFGQLAQMDEPGFNSVLEELNHDPVAQHVKHWLSHGKNFAEALLIGLSKAAGKVSKELEVGVWPWLSASEPKDLARYPKTAVLVRQIRRHTQEKERKMNWFARLHK